MARLIISDGTTRREVELTDAVTVAGRSSDNKIVIEDKQSSRRHFQIEKTEFGYKLVDLESRNGSRVNDRVVNQALLRPGDRIQIGKHTLTFEDPQFREPSAEVAARFAPPAAPVPPPPSAAPASKPAAPSSEPEPEPRARRRTSTGNTTAILVQRTARIEQAREAQMIRWVGVGAGLFIVILVILIAVPGSGGGAPEGTKPPPVKPGDPDPKKAAAAAALAEAESHDFEALSEYCEKNKTNPLSFERVLSLCAEFRKKYPSSLSLAKVQEYVNAVQSAKQGARGKEVDDAMVAALEQARKNDFAGAVRSANALIAKHNDDVELRAKLVKMHDDIVDQAQQHYKSRLAEGKDLTAQGKKDEAAQLYEALVRSLGDGAVEEMAVWSQIAKTALSGLK